MSLMESEAGDHPGQKSEILSHSSPLAPEVVASLAQNSVLGATSLMLAKATTPRSGLQFKLSLGRSSNRKNRVLEVFPSEIFANGTLRKEFYLPLRIANAARDILDTRPYPYIKMINPLSIHALSERHSRIMALHEASKGIDSSESDSFSLAGSILEAEDRLIRVLQLQQGIPIMKYTLSLGLAMIDYVKEGCHSRDTSFFLLYMLSSESSGTSSPGSTCGEDCAKAPIDSSESKSPKNLRQRRIGEDRWMSGTETGKWFVFAIVDLLQMSPKKEGDSDMEPRISVDTENLERIATEYGRYLLKKEVPPRPDEDSPVKPRRGRKPKQDPFPKNLTPLSVRIGKSSVESESETSLRDKGEEVSSEPSAGSLDHDVEKGKRGKKRGRQSSILLPTKRPAGGSLPDPREMSIDGGLNSACNMLVSLNSPGIPALSPQILPLVQNSNQLFGMTPVNTAKPVVPSLISLPHVSPIQGTPGFIDAANKSQGIGFFHLAPSTFVPGTLPVAANLSPLIFAAAANNQSPSPARTVFCLPPNVSPLFSPSYFYSPALMNPALQPNTKNPNPVNSSLAYNLPVQSFTDDHKTQSAQQQQTPVVAPSQLHPQQNVAKSDGNASTNVDSSK